MTLNKSTYAYHVLWKIRLKHDHHFNGNQNFSVKSTTFLLKKFRNSWFHGILWAWSRFHITFHIVVDITGILSRIFGKNFVKVAVLLILKSWFDEICFRWDERFSRFSTLWNLNAHVHVDIWFHEIFIKWMRISVFSAVTLKATLNQFVFLVPKSYFIKLGYL